MSDLTLGQKIRKYRLQTGKSQYDLELEMGASPGTISRIEKDKTNPTKETLLAIARCLELESKEIADLFAIEIDTFEKLILSINSLFASLDLQTTLQTAVDMMIDLFPQSNGGVLFLLETEPEDKLYTKTVSRLPRIHEVFRLLSKPFGKFNLSLREHKDNLVIKSVLEGGFFESFDLYDFGKGAAPELVTKQISKVLSFGAGVAMPLKAGEQVIGAALYTKKVKSKFSSHEIKLLELLSDQLALAIRNAREYDSLKRQLQLLNNN